MGAANVVKVYQSWPHLEDRAFRLLAYMALIARDRDAEPWYGAGHDELAQIALGLPITTERERQDARRTVRLYMTQLRRALAIETTKKAARGRHARYRLYLDGPAEGSNSPVNNSANSHERRSVGDLRPVANVGESLTFEHQNVGQSLHQRRGVAHLPIEEKEEEVLQEQERRTSKAKLRNGELWKAAHAHAVNGFATPAIHANEPAPHER